MDGPSEASTRDILAEAKKAFELANEAENDNRKMAADDLRFARLGEQWPERIKKERETENRPCHTFNKLTQYVRQVVNDARQNKPSIKVHPADSNADTETATVIDGLIRNIEYTSNAEVAYDTAVENAVSMGWGYFKIAIDYAHDDAFDLDIRIERVSNPFSIYGDPYSKSADSSDWNSAFEIEWLTKDEFKRQFPGEDPSDWEGGEKDGDWINGDMVLVARWWEREEVPVTRLMLSNGMVISEQQASEIVAQTEMGPMTFLDTLMLEDGVTVKETRETKTWLVRSHLLSGGAVLKTEEWPGHYIPIVPVYGDEVIDDKGKRHLRSLIHDAMDAQRDYNYWRPLALDTPLPTPSGWTTMGDVKVGDQIFDDDGNPCAVVGKSPVHINHECYEVMFDDGSRIVADANHPWMVEERNKSKIVTDGLWSTREVTTSDLVPDRHFIWATKPLQCVDRELPVHPYVFGLWLGDGFSAGGRICPGDEDLDEIRSNIEAAGYRCSPTHYAKGRHGIFNVYELAGQLREAGLIGRKRIPEAYLRASEAQRWALLQGLMDSDGSINKINGACDFTSTSEGISRGFAELLRSLGIKAKSVKRAGRASKVVNGDNGLKDATQFYFSAYADEPVFGLARKAALLGGRPEHRRRTKRHRIVSVNRVASVPVQCVAIDAPSHLFLAGEAMVPTHNTTATERVALTPKAPFIGRKGSFKSDRRWETANTVNHPYLEYDGDQPPQRQPLDMGPAAGALQQAMVAADDIKSSIGLYDSSTGAQSNEVSGRAIMARERQGDVGTFHFTDNLSRAIRHAGRIIIDLIPHIYTGERIIRIMGEDGTPRNVGLNQPVPQKGPDGKPVMQPQMGMNGQPIVGPDNRPIMKAITRIYDLSAGKYDLTVSTGPSYTTQRQEAADQMMELIRIMPPAAPLIGDLVAKNLDWPGADEIAKRLKIMLPPQLNGGLPPEVQQMIEQGKKQIDQQGQLIQQMQAYILQLESDNSAKQRKVDVDAFNAETKRLDTETKRMDVLSDIQEKGASVPDVQGLAHPDYEGIVATARANHLNAVAGKENAQADLARAKTVKELLPPQPPMGPQHILHPTHPRQQF